MKLRDEPLSEMEVEKRLHGAGVKVLATRQLAHALRLAETSALSAAVLDFNQRPNVPVLLKPAARVVLVGAACSLVGDTSR